MLQNNIKYYNPNLLQIPDHLYKMSLVGGSWPVKMNSLFNLISHQPDIHIVYLYAKDPSEAKYRLLINKRKRTDLKHFNDPKGFIEYSSDMNDIKSIEEYNSD